MADEPRFDFGSDWQIRETTAGDLSIESRSTGEAQVISDNGEFNTGLIKPEAVGDVRYVGDGYDFETIQAAHDDLHLNDIDGAVYVTSDYDWSKETYPIYWTSQNGLMSNDRTQIGDPSITAENIIEVNYTADIDGDGVINEDPREANLRGNRPPGPWFKNLNIRGGQHGMYFESVRWTHSEKVDVEDCASHGWRWNHVTVDPDGDGPDGEEQVAINSHSLVACTSAGCGDSGFSVDSVAHDINFINCTAQFNSEYGVYIDNAVSCSWYGGAIQLNDSNGAYVNRSDGMSFRDVYIENNGEDGTLNSNSEIYIDNAASSTSIVNCYFNVDDNHDFCVQMIANGTTFRDNYVRTHEGMPCYVQVIAGDDNDIHENSNYDMLQLGTETIIGSEDSGGRTRSHGVVGAGSGGYDLSTVQGKYNGDEGLDDGTNSSHGRYQLAVWDASASEWIMQNDGTAVAA